MSGKAAAILSVGIVAGTLILGIFIFSTADRLAGVLRQPAKIYLPVQPIQLQTAPSQPLRLDMGSTPIAVNLTVPSGGIRLNLPADGIRLTVAKGAVMVQPQRYKAIGKLTIGSHWILDTETGKVSLESRP